MAADASTPRTRRAILAAAAGAAAATVASAVTRPSPVAALNGAPGDFIHVGDTYSGISSQTTLGNQATDDIVLWVASNGDIGNGGGTALVGYSHHGIGVQGQNGTSGTGMQGTSVSGDGVQGVSASGRGVYGTSTDSYGVYGVSTSNMGVRAQGDNYGVYAVASGTGVYGQSTTSYGVHGQSSSGYGVFGSSNTNVSVYAYGSGPSVAASVGLASTNGTGVQGYSGTGLLPAAKTKTGVYGYANQDGKAKGVYGESSKGFAGYFIGKVYTNKFHEMKEISTPAAPGANKVRLFARDNGSGKTQLCVRFPTGAVQVIKTQP